MVLKGEHSVTGAVSVVKRDIISLALVGRESLRSIGRVRIDDDGTVRFEYDRREGGARE